jgi:hypothetical protein
MIGMAGRDYVTTLSLSDSGQLLLISESFTGQLYIYSASSGLWVNGFNLPKHDIIVNDAVWLPHNDSYIMCATQHGLMYFMPVMRPEMGYGVSTGNITLRYFSVSHDNVIYATDTDAGVFQLHDGVMWRQVAKNELEGQQRAWHAVRVPTNSYFDKLWVIIMTPDKSCWFLRIYTISNVSSGENQVWCNVTVPAQVNLYLQ